MTHMHHIYSGNFFKRYRPSKLFGYELVPNLFFEEDSNSNTNSFGMRDKEYIIEKPTDTFRILLLGDSTSETPIWHVKLEENLNKDFKCEILNAAVSGWNIYQYWQYVKNKTKIFKPDLILIAFCLNDLNGTSYVPTILFEQDKIIFFSIKSNNICSTITKTTSINPYIFKHSYVYRFLVNRFIISKAEKYPFSQDMDEKEIVKDMLLEIKQIANNKILAIIFPYLKPLEQYNETQNRQYVFTKEMLNLTSIKFLDLTEYFNSFGKDIIKFRDKPTDEIHFNEKANNLKSEIIYKWLKENL